MDIQGKMQLESIKQQIRLLKANNRIKILKHVEGRAALIHFKYDNEMEGNIILKGTKYKVFVDSGGLKDITVDEVLESDAEVDYNGKNDKEQKNRDDDKRGQEQQGDSGEPESLPNEDTEDKGEHEPKSK